MDFGDLHDISSVDFTLQEPRFLSQLIAPPKKDWYLGCPIWSHKGLLKRLTKQKSDRHELEVYSRSFNSIELNSSYYNIPTQEQIKKWKSFTPDYFKFFPKAPKDLCFRPYDKLPHHLLDLYFDSLNNFGEKLEESFLQFSPYISPHEKKYVFDLLESLPENFKFSIELRHADWFTNKAQLLRLCEYLNKKNIGLVLTDTPGRRDVLPMIFTTNRAFIRFKGHNNCPLDYERLNEWIGILKNSKYLSKVYFFHHHSDEQYCIDTIKYFQKTVFKESQNSLPEIDLKKNNQLSLI